MLEPPPMSEPDLLDPTAGEVLAAARSRRDRFRDGLVRYRDGIFGIGWSGLGQVVSMVIRFGSNLILTRLLLPEVYGIFNVALAFIGTLEFFSDFGVQPALIRHPEGMTRRYLLTGWCVGVSRGAVLSLLVALLAYPVAQFERQPALTVVLVVLSARPLISSLRSPGIPRLRREMDYRALFFLELIELLVSMVVSIVMAYLTHSIWAIIIGTMASMLAGVVASYALAPIRPSWLWDREVIRDVSGLGRQIIFNTMAMALWLHLDRLLGSRYVENREMGYYVIALTLATIAEVMISKVCDVYFSMLVRHGDAGDRRAWNRRICLFLSVAVMPGIALVVVLAPSIVGLLYRSEWAPAKVLLGILTARVMVRGLAQLQYEYLLSTGNIRLNTMAYFLAAAVQAVMVIPMIRAFGVAGLAWSSLASSLAYVGYQTVAMKLKGDAALLPLVITCAWAAIGLALMGLQLR